MRKKNFLGVFGHVNIDYILKIDQMPLPNTSIAVNGLYTRYGGTAGNIAVLASQLNVKVSLASFIGKNFPPEYLKKIKDANVDITDVVTMKKYPTSTCYLLTWKENQIGLMFQGPMDKMDRYPVLKHTVDTSEIIHITTGKPEYYLKVAKYAKTRGKTVVIDPGQEIHYVYNTKIFKQMLNFSDMFFASEAEYQTAKKYLGIQKEEEILGYVDTFILTKGKKGSVIYTDNRKIMIPTIKPRHVVDITGAGDAYRAGFYAGLCNKLSFEECGLIGAALASYIIEHKGSQIYNLTFDKILNRLKKSHVRLSNVSYCSTTH